MYRVNLYREREGSGSRARRRLAVAGGLGLLVGLEAVVIGFLLVSGHLLRERIPDLSAAVEEAGPLAGDDHGTELRLATAVVTLRGQRFDWAPCLDAVARSIPASLVLESISAGERLDRNQAPGIDLEGRLGSSGGDIGPVLEFVDTLRADPAMAATFPRIDLEKSDADRTRTFKIICRMAGELDS